MVLCFYGSTFLHFYGSMVLQFYGIMVLYSVTLVVEYMISILNWTVAFILCEGHTLVEELCFKVSQFRRECKQQSLQCFDFSCSLPPDNSKLSS